MSEGCGPDFKTAPFVENGKVIEQSAANTIVDQKIQESLDVKVACPALPGEELQTQLQARGPLHKAVATTEPNFRTGVAESQSSSDGLDILILNVLNYIVDKIIKIVISYSGLREPTGAFASVISDRKEDGIVEHGGATPGVGKVARSLPVVDAVAKGEATMVKAHASFLRSGIDAKILVPGATWIHIPAAASQLQTEVPGVTAVPTSQKAIVEIAAVSQPRTQALVSAAPFHRKFAMVASAAHLKIRLGEKRRTKHYIRETPRSSQSVVLLIATLFFCTKQRQYAPDTAGDKGIPSDLLGSPKGFLCLMQVSCCPVSHAHVPEGTG